MYNGIGNLIEGKTKLIINLSIRESNVTYCLDLKAVIAYSIASNSIKRYRRPIGLNNSHFNRGIKEVKLLKV